LDAALRSHSECAGIVEGGTAGLWRLIASDLQAAGRRHRSDPAWFLQGWRQAWTGIAVRLLFQPLPALCNLRVK
jgi:hypothetical protein